MPQLHGVIVHDRMIDVIAKHSREDVPRILLALKLCRMYSDDDQFIWVLPFEPLQIRNNVHAIDAAVCPEVEKYDLATQLLEADGLTEVQPVQSGGKFQRVHFPFVWRQRITSRQPCSNSATSIA